MHNRKRIDYAAEAANESELLRQRRLDKIEKYNKLSSILLQRKKNKKFDRQSLKLCEKILSINPEYNTIWNFRRQCILAIEECVEVASLKELEVTESALRKNPKSYVAWHHRRWALEKSPSTDWNKELELCTKFLSMDARNFHCWDHRRFVVPFSDATTRQEFTYTTSLINDNFSNYSAWHYRSILLKQIKKENEMEFRDLLKEEYQLVKSAFYTEPDDQSAWLYHRWLLSNEIVSLSSISNLRWKQEETPHLDETNLARLETELLVCRDLLQNEPNCKWAILTFAVIVVELERYGEDVSDAKKELSEFLPRLPSIDPLRSNYYSQVLEYVQL